MNSEVRSLRLLIICLLAVSFFFAGCDALTLRFGSAESLNKKGLELLDVGRFQEAIEYFDRAIEKDPKYLEAYVGRGRASLRLDKLNDALQNCQQALELNKDSVEARTLLAEIHFAKGLAAHASGNFPDAVNYFNLADREQPGNYDLYVKRAASWLKMGQPQEAVADCEKAIALKQEGDEPYLIRAEAFKASNDSDRALEDYNAVLDRHPSHVDAYLGRAEIRMERRELQEATDDLSRVISLDPKNSTAYRLRARLFADQQQFDRARADLNTVIQVDPKNVEAYLDRSQLPITPNQFSWEESLADLNRAAEVAPNDIRIYEMRANTYVLMGQPEKSIADYTKAIELDPKKGENYYGRAQAFNYAGNAEGALKDIQEAVRINPDQKANYELLGEVCEKSEKYEEAYYAYSQALAIYPDNAGTLNRRGRLLIKIEMFKEAREDLLKAHFLFPEASNYTRDLAWLLATCPQKEIRDGAAAVELATKVMDLSPKDVKSFITLAAAFYEVGKCEDALTTQQKALEMAERQGGTGIDKVDMNLRLGNYKACAGAGGIKPTETDDRKQPYSY